MQSNDAFGGRREPRTDHLGAIVDCGECPHRFVAENADCSRHDDDGELRTHYGGEPKCPVCGTYVADSETTVTRVAARADASSPKNERYRGKRMAVKNRHGQRLLDAYPEPLNWLAAMLFEANLRKWIGTGTYGEEQVVEYGLTENQYRFCERLAADVDGDRQYCSHCGVFVVGDDPDACPECDANASELQPAEIRHV